MFKPAADTFTIALEAVMHACEAADRAASHAEDRAVILANIAALPKNYVVFNTKTRVQPTNVKYWYKRAGDAKRAADRLNAAAERMGYAARYTSSSEADYVRGNDLVVVFNAMTGKPVLELDGTPFTASVASESYWSA